MAKCSLCGDKISFWSEYSEGDKSYCEKCWKTEQDKIKKDKIKGEEERRGEIKNRKEVTIKINKEDKAKQKRAGWGLVGLIGLAIMIIWFMSMHYSDKADEYSYCVDMCVYDNSDCINKVYPLSDKYGEEYLEIFEVESCTNDLESCVSDCQG